MFLSKLILNHRSRQVRREIAEPYEMHRTLMRGFPADLKSLSERVLFRLDPDPPIILVQSLSMPNWVPLQEMEGYLLAQPEFKEFQPSFGAGQKLCFCLRANPTVKRDGKRRGLLTEESQKDWLERKAQAGGFRVSGLQIVRERMAFGHKTRDGEGQDMAHLSVRYDGLLEVTNPDQMLKTLQAGIGSGKGFGFGLLSLKRLE